MDLHSELRATVQALVQVANAAEVQRALLHRARLNGAARRGQYSKAMEAATSAFGS